MAGTRRPQDKDVIARLADAGEDALRRLVDLPRRIVVGTIHDVATRLRAIDPLDGRVGAIERRLDSLEQPKKTTRRTASTRAKPPRARKAGTASALEPEQAQDDPGRPDDARAEYERERADARAEDEGEQDR